MKTKISESEIRMHYVVCLLLFPLLLVSCTNKPVIPNPEEAKAAIMKKIESAAEKWSNSVTTGYTDCAAKDVVWIDDLGASKPVQGLQALKDYLETFSGKIPVHKYKLLDPLFQFYDDIVIVTYRYQGTLKGEPPASPWKVTSVYRYTNGDWLSVHENWSEVKEETVL